MKIFTAIFAFSSLLIGTEAFALPVDSPQHGGAFTTLVDLNAGGFVSLRSGPPGGANFAPAASSGAARCGSRRNGLGGAVQCAFTDNNIAAGLGWHGEFVVHNPNPFVMSFNAGFFDGWGNVYAGRVTLGIDSSLYVDMHVADVSLPHFSETGTTTQWAAWLNPAGIPLDATFSTIEGGPLVGAPGLLPCPLRVSAVQGQTPQGAFECLFRFFSAPEDAWVLAEDDPNLPSFSLNDPAVKGGNPDLLPGIDVPEPASLLLLGLAGIVPYIRKAGRELF